MSASGRWVGQRECAVCEFTGPETEFALAAILDDAEVIVAPLDSAQTLAVVICGGCAEVLKSRIQADPRDAFERVVDLWLSGVLTHV